MSQFKSLGASRPRGPAGRSPSVPVRLVQLGRLPLARASVCIGVWSRSKPGVHRCCCLCVNHFLQVEAPGSSECRRDRGGALSPGSREGDSGVLAGGGAGAPHACGSAGLGRAPGTADVTGSPFPRCAGRLKRVLQCCPEVLTMRLRDLDGTVRVLRDKCLFTAQQVTEILHRCPFVLREDPDELEYKFQVSGRLQAGPRWAPQGGGAACGGGASRAAACHCVTAVTAGDAPVLGEPTLSLGSPRPVSEVAGQKVADTFSPEPV